MVGEKVTIQAGVFEKLEGFVKDVVDGYATVDIQHDGHTITAPIHISNLKVITNFKEIGIKMKKIYMSKVLWANLLAIALLVIDRLTSMNIIPATTAVLVLAVINIILRALTNQPLQLPLITPKEEAKP